MNIYEVAAPPQCFANGDWNMTNRVYQIGYTVNGERRYERISSPDMESAERSWKHYRSHVPYTQFTIWNPDHSGPAKQGDIIDV